MKEIYYVLTQKNSILVYISICICAYLLVLFTPKEVSIFISSVVLKSESLVPIPILQSYLLYESVCDLHLYSWSTAWASFSLEGFGGGMKFLCLFLQQNILKYLLQIAHFILHLHILSYSTGL